MRWSFAIVSGSVLAACGATDAEVSVLQARPGAGDPTVTTLGRLQPSPDLSLPVVISGPAADNADGSAAPTTVVDGPIRTGAPLTPGVPTTPVAVPLVPLTFGWAVPCAVPVTEVREFADNISRLQYVVRLEADPASGGLVMRQTEVEVLNVNGEIPTADVVDLITVGMRVPDVLVGFDGIETGARGTEQLLEEMTAAGAFDDEPLTPEDRVAAIERLESNATLKYWSTWVGGWAGLATVPNEVNEVGGIRLETVPTPEPNRVRLRYTEDLSGAELAESVGVTEANGDPSAYDKVRRVNLIEAITDPATLRPDWATFAMDVTGEFANEPASLHEVHTVEFNWAAAEGCGVS